MSQSVQPGGAAPPTRWAPPESWGPAAIRVAALVAAGLIFWLDLIAATPGMVVPALYVVPILLFLWGGRVWEAPVAAAGTTFLAVAVAAMRHGDASIVRINLIVEVIVLWLCAGLVVRYRAQVEAWAKHDREARAETERTLQRLQELRYAIDQAAIVAVTDQKGIITSVNDKFCEISKYSRDELIGQDHRLINSGYHSKEYMRDLWRTIARGQVWRGELRNRAKDGTFYWVDTTIVPFLDERGKPRQYLAIRSDITRRKAAEAQLSAQAALMQLGQLAAVVAHEVRNPLAGLRATLEVIRTRFPGAAREREIIQAMIDRIDALNAKVDDILRFASPRSPVPRTVEIAPIVNDAATSAAAAAGKDCPLIEYTPSPLAVRADPEMLRAAILNVVLNACQAGGDRVEIEAEAVGSMCRIRVLDRGPGIPAEMMARVFDAFYTTKKAGTGLGLPIVKRLVELMNGHVALYQRDGGGTIAEIEVPLAAAAETTAAPPQAEAAQAGAAS